MNQMCQLVLVALCVVFLVPVYSAPTNSKPKVTLLYESLCPFCHIFINEQLFPTYAKLHDYIDIELVPYGNAHAYNVNNKTVIMCQHGEDECYGNTAQACAFDLLKSQKASLDFVYCMSSSKLSTTEESSKECAEKQKIDYTKLKACIDGEQGRILISKFEKRTEQFPEKSYVPWVMINEKLNDNSRKYLFQILCDDFLKDKKLPECNANL